MCEVDTSGVGRAEDIAEGGFRPPLSMGDWVVGESRSGDKAVGSWSLGSKVFGIWREDRSYDVVLDPTGLLEAVEA
jgi:hypothetical protein